MGEHLTIQQRLIRIAESMERIRASTEAINNSLGELYSLTIPRDSWNSEPARRFGVGMAVGRHGQIVRVVDGKPEPNLTHGENGDDGL